MKIHTWKKQLRGRRSKKATKSNQHEKVLSHKEYERTSSKSTLDENVRENQMEVESREENSIREASIKEMNVGETTGADMQQIRNNLDHEKLKQILTRIQVHAMNKTK